jgi:transcription factor SPN1
LELLANAEKLRPGDPGWVNRARVPMPDTNEYVARPEWQSAVDMNQTTKKSISLLEKHKRLFADKKRSLKSIQAVKISIEGKDMSGY